MKYVHISVITRLFAAYNTRDVQFSGEGQAEKRNQQKFEKWDFNMEEVQKKKKKKGRITQKNCLK